MVRKSRGKTIDLQSKLQVKIKTQDYELETTKLID